MENNIDSSVYGVHKNSFGDFDVVKMPAGQENKYLGTIPGKNADGVTWEEALKEYGELHYCILPEDGIVYLAIQQKNMPLRYIGSVKNV